MEVHGLRQRGWSISAIARHLGRDPKTIRAYLSGQREPGRRASGRLDPLASFAPSVRARFVDGPHLWATALFDEVVPLGYGGSYVSFARQLRLAGFWMWWASGSPRRRWPTSARPGYAPRAGCGGCISASTDKHSLITCHDKRDTVGMDAAAVLPRFTGIAVHDAWAPYDTYPASSHALCNAHALRELQAVTDQSPAAGWCWAEQASDALREMKDLVDTALTTHATLAGIEETKLVEQVHRDRSTVVLGASQTAARSTKLMAKHHALARRLITREEDYLRFTTDPTVPFDNNAAEVRHEVARYEWTRRKEGRPVNLSAA